MSTHVCIDCDSPGDGNCAACHGSGKIGTENFVDNEGGGVTCSSCGGNGLCPKCEGHGEVEVGGEG